MKILKKTNNKISLTKPLLDLAREHDIELHYLHYGDSEDSDILRIFSNDDDNAFVEYKIDFNKMYVKDFVVTFDYQYEMRAVKGIPQTLKTKTDYRNLFQAIQLALKTKDRTMDTRPQDELTPIFLGIILNDGKITAIDPACNTENHIGYESKKGGILNYYTINIDTLTRLMKEWLINDTNDIINTYNSTSVQGWVCASSKYNQGFITETEFEAVLKLTNWVAKERGII